MDATCVQFIVHGSGVFAVTADSARGGLFREDDSLPQAARSSNRRFIYFNHLRTIDLHIGPPVSTLG